MKIVFIENRERTRFWEGVAEILGKKGVEVGWVIQNPVFSPKMFRRLPSVHLIAFPKELESHEIRSNQGVMKPAWFKRVKGSDRGVRYFHGRTDHYEYYYSEIRRILEEERPDLVVGEATLFHELIAIEVCIELDIPYVQPASTRYPSGRFFLFRQDTQHPLLRSGESLEEPYVERLAKRIANFDEVPFYMQRPDILKRSWRAFRRLRSSSKVFAGWVMGERFNTPSPIRKLQLEKRRRQSIAAWKHVEALPKNPSKTIMYPLQLQPEANIDVWGREWRDQTALVLKLAELIPGDYQVAVKANPKAKYEITNNLVSIAQSESKVVLLPFDLSMEQVRSLVCGAVTVTGTVGFEAVFGRISCISLSHPILSQNFPAYTAENVPGAVRKIVFENEKIVGNVEEGRKLLNEIVSSSFKGVIGDPVLYPDSMNVENYNCVAKAILKVLE